MAARCAIVGHWIGEYLLFRVLPYFGRHVKPLVTAAFAVVSTTPFPRGFTTGRQPVVKIIAESLPTHLYPPTP
jgi:hypothetical protein